MDLSSFTIAALPCLVFGAGRIAELPSLAAEFGRSALLVTGGRSFRNSPHWPALLQGLEQRGIAHAGFAVEGEPSPEMVDAAVRQFRAAGIELVIGIGGGSVLDAAKAIAGLLPSGNSVLDHLEDVGRGIPYHGPSLPFIAVPTTAGTGSEATKNAVLSRHGPDGFKKSFRHDCMVAKVALVDPQLLAACPRHLMAAQGMDAFTQLLESYVSLRANPFTDALAWSGLEAVAGGFWPAWEGGDTAPAAAGRAAMAYAALLSGITLAQVGLGAVHGLAQPLGSLFPVPHGVACGTTVAAATAVNVQALQQRAPGSPALHKYARVGRLLGGNQILGDAAAAQVLVTTLESWCVRLELPRLGQFGIGDVNIPAIVAASRNNSMKSNPVLLTDAEIAAIVRQRL
jgi:alcohol dehydrogenase